MGLVVILTAGQFLLHRDHVCLLRQSVHRDNVRKAVRWLRRVARVIDRWSKLRLTALTRGARFVVTAVACTVMAAATPIMEVVS